MSSQRKEVLKERQISLYKEFGKKKCYEKENNELRQQLIEANKTINASVKYFNTTPYIYRNKYYKAYIKALSKHGYYPKNK